MTSYKLIVVNTATTYIRSIFAAGLSLFSSRWVLNALGHSDYGLFVVVGSLIIFVTFINSTMSGSAARYFAYSIGKGDSNEVKRWFNSALCIHICLAFLLILIAWPVGEYVVVHTLKVPNERLTTCLWVFRLSLLSAFFNMISVPFVAMFTAKQRIAEIAVWGMAQSIIVFAFAWFLQFSSGDRLLFYSIGMVAILIIIQIIQVFRAIVVFNECGINFRRYCERDRFKDLFLFASWSLIGNTGAIFRDQGSSVLLNLFFGPTVNAAYGIATQVSIQTTQFSTAMIGAFSPEITASEGRGNRSNMLSLSLSASKFGALLVLPLAIPLVVEIDYILKLWLGVPPPFSASLCQLILVTFLIDRLSMGYWLAAQACGKIAIYQATIGSSHLLALPLAWFFLKFGFGPPGVGFAFVISISISSFGRVLWGKRLLGITVYHWFITVVWPYIIVILVSTAIALVFNYNLSPSFFRFALVTSSSIVSSLLAIWFFVLNYKERSYVKQKLDLKILF